MYTQKELDRIVELFNGIEGNKEHEYAAPTYKDSPALKEMAAIILGCTEDTAEVLPEKITVLTYLSKCYDEMCRAGMSVKYYKMLLTCYVKLSKLEKLSKDDKKHFEEAFYNAVKARNWYVPDDCADLKEILSGAISDKKMDELYQKAVDSRKGLPKNDPVEEEWNRKRAENGEKQWNSCRGYNDYPAFKEYIGVGKTLGNILELMSDTYNQSFILWREKGELMR